MDQTPLIVISFTASLIGWSMFMFYTGYIMGAEKLKGDILRDELKKIQLAIDKQIIKTSTISEPEKVDKVEIIGKAKGAVMKNPSPEQIRKQREKKAIEEVMIASKNYKLKKSGMYKI